MLSTSQYHRVLRNSAQYSFVCLTTASQKDLPISQKSRQCSLFVRNFANFQNPTSPPNSHNDLSRSCLHTGNNKELYLIYSWPISPTLHEQSFCFLQVEIDLSQTGTTFLLQSCTTQHDIHQLQMSIAVLQYS